MQSQQSKKEGSLAGFPLFLSAWLATVDNACREGYYNLIVNFRSISAHSYDYELSSEQKSGLKLPDFRFCPHSPTAF